MIVGFLAPAVIIFLIVFLYPIIRTIMMSMYKIESVTDTMDGGHLLDWATTRSCLRQRSLKQQ